MAIAKMFPTREDLASLSRDTKLLYLFTFAFGVVGGLYFLVLPFYLLEAGYDATSIGLVNSIAGVALTLLTIPAGLLADAYGRKRSIIMGSLLVILTQLVLSISSDFFVVALAVLIGGIGVAFIFSSSYPTLHSRQALLLVGYPNCSPHLEWIDWHRSDLRSCQEHSP